VEKISLPNATLEPVDVLSRSHNGNGNGTAASHSPHPTNRIYAYPAPAPALGALATIWDKSRTFARGVRSWFTWQRTANEDVAGNGVYAITRNTNYWFNRELAVIEQDATLLAAQWAEKGLPRHDVERTGPVEPEQVLAMKCMELYRQWRDRVAIKMQDAIQAASGSMSTHITSLRAAIYALESNNSQRREAEREIENAHTLGEADKSRVGYDRIFKSRAGFWIFAGILAAAEFTANFPVFRLLLPMDSTLTQLAQSLGEAAESNSWLAGPLVVFQDMLLHFEAFVVALVAVVILVLLGKTAGSSIRSVVAFSTRESPLASTSIRSNRRQNLVVFVAAVAGIAFVLTFLYSARAQIAQTAADRVHADSLSLQQAQAAQAAAGTDLSKTAATTQRELEASRVLQQHSDDAAYAITVQRINSAILWLNLGLVLAAMTLGFVYKQEELSDKRGEHPILGLMRARIKRLDGEAIKLKQAAQAAQNAAQTEAGRINHLVRSNPLRDWRGKQERLQSVIPLFRGENARQRRIDPASILAFREPYLIPLPELDETVELRTPVEFDQQVDELEKLTHYYAHVVGVSSVGTQQFAAARTS
jgi:preprotein translocase subunit SecG